MCLILDDCTQAVSRTAPCDDVCRSRSRSGNTACQSRRIDDHSLTGESGHSGPASPGGMWAALLGMTFNAGGGWLTTLVGEEAETGDSAHSSTVEMTVRRMRSDRSSSSESARRSIGSTDCSVGKDGSDSRARFMLADESFAFMRHGLTGFQGDRKRYVDDGRENRVWYVTSDGDFVSRRVVPRQSMMRMLL